MTNPAEAAERLRGSRRVYRDFEPWQINVDMQTLAHAYLAEHQADDGEAITESTFSELEDERIHLGGSFTLEWDSGLWLDVEGHYLDLRHIKTQGQLRRLLELLRKGH